MEYFSSDWHIAHKNILKYDNRDFKTIEDMNHHIISNATKQLKEGDKFYYLGDFCLGSMNVAEGCLKSLSYTGAELFFIKGNHDKSDMVKLYEKYGTYFGEKKTIKISHEGEIYMITLDHFANRVWDKSHHGSYHFYGHSHDGLEREPWGRSIDIGIMTALRIKGDYLLFSFEELHNILKKRDPKIIDHHTGKTNE